MDAAISKRKVDDSEMKSRCHATSAGRILNALNNDIS